MTASGWQDRLAHPRFPRSSSYDATWVLEHHMGPHPLWLLESLCERRSPSPQDRVLDLGCGQALTSVFLAREFGVAVVAADWWIAPEDNLGRLEAAGVSSSVTSLRAEAHAIPLASGQFDAVISIDAYHYFGTSDLYLAEMTRLLRPGGWLGIVVPGVREEPDEIPPPALAAHWDWDFCSFHSPRWWLRHWAKTGLVHVDDAWWIEGGHEFWLRWAEITDDYARSMGQPPYKREVELLHADRDRLLGFTAIIATKGRGSLTGLAELNGGRLEPVED
jgi:cyclopropane fatty-acyl-phospholipid synthase-like methyltransferase